MSHKLYDIHYHAFDLSHANLLAFLAREDLITKEGVHGILKSIPWYMRLLPIGVAQLAEAQIAGAARKFITTGANNFKSLLSVIENAIEYHFLYVDYFLRNREPFIGDPARYRHSADFPVDRIVLCPLLMDFGYKNLANNNQFYNIPPGKPIVNQIVDIFNAIWFYYRYDLEVKAGGQRLTATLTRSGKEGKLFEIYPFLGINTANYTLPEIRRVFEKYFAGFENDTPAMRQQKLYEKMGELRIDITSLSSRDGGPDYSYAFAGIKVYPPLGFDPWPDDPAEREKVEFLYQSCIEKRIPVITHCSDGGFITDPHGREFTDPGLKWNSVLTHPAYNALTLDFAHFGSMSSGSLAWKKSILEHFKNAPNVVSDISCCGMKPAFYDYFSAYLNPRTDSRFLFGSDFLINLIWSESYNQYLDCFMGTKALNDEQKTKIGRLNPARFLFG